MQYIYFKHIKTDEDKKRVKNHPKMTKKELEKILDGNKEIKIITEDIQGKSKIVALENRKLIFKEISKTLTQKKHYLSGFIKKDHFAQKKLPIELKDGNQTFLLNSLEATATDLFYIKRIRENSHYFFWLCICIYIPILWIKSQQQITN